MTDKWAGVYALGRLYLGPSLVVMAREFSLRFSLKHCPQYVNVNDQRIFVESQVEKKNLLPVSFF
jgi:hypothetical protein